MRSEGLNLLALLRRPCSRARDSGVFIFYPQHGPYAFEDKLIWMLKFSDVRGEKYCVWGS